MLLLALLLCMLPVGQAMAWETPCIDAPYDYSYEDERRAICINRFTGEDLVYYIADVQISSADVWHTALSGKQMKPISELVEGEDVVLAINADDYRTHSNGIIIRNGELLRQKETSRHLLIVDANGDLRVMTDRKSISASSLAEELLAERVWQTYEFGPALISEGLVLEFPKSFRLISTSDRQKEPRTAIGQIGPLHYCIIVVDGRREGHSEGMTLQGLQELFLACGAETAFNLDGGGSTELWFMGEVINRPSGARERSVSDAICF